MHSVGTPQLQYQQNVIQSLTMYIHSFQFKFPNEEGKKRKEKRKKRKEEEEEEEEEEEREKKKGGGMSQSNKWEVDFLACEMKFIGLCRQTFLNYVLFCGLVKQLRLDRNTAHRLQLSLQRL